MTATQQQPKSDQSDLMSLNDRIRHTEQVIARLTEQTHRRRIHLANLQYARGQIVNGMALTTLDEGNRDLPVPIATSRPISFTADERDQFTACQTRRMAEEHGAPTLDCSTSQLPPDFIDNDHDGHG